MLMKFGEDYGQAELQLLETLLLVAARERLYQTDIEKALRLTKSTCSRNVHRLTARKQADGSSGLGLLDATEDETDRRFTVISLTTKGKNYVDGLVNTIGD